MNKHYTIQANIGNARHVVNFHDGEKKHADGSRFYDIHIFSNAKTRDLFIRGLELDGYKP